MLILDIDDFQARVRVSKDFTFSKLRPWLQQAEQQYIQPILGPVFLQELDDHFTGSDDDAVLDAVLAEAQAALALFGMYLAIPALSLKMEDTGLHALSNDQYKSPYQWQVGDYRDSYLQAAYAAVERLYAVLEANRTNSSLASWRDSNAYSEYHDSLLRNAKEFSGVFSIGYSHITYVDLKPGIQRAQDMVLRKVVGEDFYDSLVARLADDDSSESDYDAGEFEDIAIKKLRPALAQLAVAHSTEVLFKTVNGSLLSTRYDGNGSTDVKVIDDRLHNAFAVGVRKNAMDMGMKLLSIAHAWLDRHADNLPLYKDGPGYRADINDERPASERMHNEGGFFMV
jgi:hypothetical protein